MGRFDLALPKSLKVKGEIPGYDSKRAGDRLKRKRERERAEWLARQGGSVTRKAAPAPTPAPPAPAPTPVEDVMQLQASLQATIDQPSAALDLSDVFGVASEPATRRGRKA